MYVCMHICNMYACTYIHFCPYTYISVYIQTLKYAYMHTHMDSFMSAYVHNLYVYIHITYTHTCYIYMDTYISINCMTQFSQKQNNFSNLYKLSPVNLIWLHQVYEKILYLQKHPVMLVSKMFSFIISFFLWLMLLPLILGRCCYPFFFDVAPDVSLL